MGFCEKCGKSIEDGLVFCNKCSGIIDQKLSSVSSVTEIGEDHEIFTFRARSSKWVRLTQFLPYLIGIAISLVGILPFFIEPLDSSLYLPLFTIGAIIVGFLVIFLLLRRSKQSIAYFFALIVLILTLGGTQILSDYNQIIFPLGVILSCFLLILPSFREKTQRISYLIVILITIIALGGSILFSTYAIIIFQIAFILSGVIIIISRF